MSSELSGAALRAAVLAHKLGEANLVYAPAQHPVGDFTASLESYRALLTERVHHSRGQWVGATFFCGCSASDWLKSSSAAVISDPDSCTRGILGPGGSGWVCVAFVRLLTDEADEESAGLFDDDDDDEGAGDNEAECEKVPRIELHSFVAAPGNQQGYAEGSVFLADAEDPNKPALEYGVRANVYDAASTAAAVSHRSGRLRPFRGEARELVELGVPPDDRNIWGETALILAASANLMDACNWLADCGADVNAATEVGATALMLAVERGGEDAATLCRWLLERGANARHRNQWGTTALHIAARRGHAGLCRILLEGGAEASAKDANDMTALQYAQLAVQQDWATQSNELVAALSEVAAAIG